MDHTCGLKYHTSHSVTGTLCSLCLDSAIEHVVKTIRGVRGHRKKTRKNSVKIGKNAKNRQKRKEKAEILAQENFQKTRKSAEKRNSHTPRTL